MSVFETVRNLKSFESAKDELLPRKVIGRILEAGRQAPSPGNVQSVEFIVVEDEDKKDILADAAGDKRFQEAPTDVIVLTDNDRLARKIGRDSVSDAGIAEASVSVQNMRLTAREMDVSSAWVTGFDQGRVSDNFSIPSQKEPRALLAFCHADREYDKPDRFSLGTMVFYNRYDNQIRSIFDQVEWKGVREMRKGPDRGTKGAMKKAREKLQKYL